MEVEDTGDKHVRHVMLSYPLPDVMAEPLPQHRPQVGGTGSGDIVGRDLALEDAAVFGAIKSVHEDVLHLDEDDRAHLHGVGGHDGLEDDLVEALDVVPVGPTSDLVHLRQLRLLVLLLQEDCLVGLI